MGRAVVRERLLSTRLWMPFLNPFEFLSSTPDYSVGMSARQQQAFEFVRVYPLNCLARLRAVFEQHTQNESLSKENAHERLLQIFYFLFHGPVLR